MGVVYVGVSVLLWVMSVTCFGFLFVFNSWADSTICMEWTLLSQVSEVVELVVVFDVLSLSFVGVVCLISGSVCFYASDYMSATEESLRFLIVLLVFVVSMCFLVMIPSVLGLIIGWDGLGISSFLLVVYYQNSYSLSSGMITALTNRIGDGLIVVSMGFSLVLGHWSLFYGFGGVLWLCLLFSAASMTKSAQMPFCSWLPAAMAAPTPVSSLVHSSTLVTAGSYLIIRYSKCLGSFNFWDDFLVVIGCLTMLMAGIGGMFEGDMKKVVAMSTLSQLGMMFFVLGMGFTWFCLFHVYMHALFKALLFISVGSVIHSSMDQDIYKMGGLWLGMPVSSGFIILSCLCLGGVPFLSGFFSKDLIVEACLNGDLTFVMGFGMVVGIWLTILYSLRLCVYVMSDVCSGVTVAALFSESKVMVVSMVVLSLGAVFGGFLGGSSLGCSSIVCMEFLVKLVPVFAIVGGLYCCLLFDEGGGDVREYSMKSWWVGFFNQMWFLPVFSGEVSSGVASSVGSVCVRDLEYGWVEVFGGQGSAEVASKFLEVHQRAQNLDFSGQLSLIFLTMIFMLISFCCFSFFS